MCYLGVHEFQGHEKAGTKQTGGNFTTNSDVSCVPDGKPC